LPWTPREFIAKHLHLQLFLISPRSPEVGVGAIGRNQLIVRTPFRDSTIIDDGNQICIMSALKSVGNSDHGSALENGAKGALEMSRCLLIQKRSRLIEDQCVRICQHKSCQGKLLCLGR
jgi:hypothetical protein